MANGFAGTNGVGPSVGGRPARCKHLEKSTLTAYDQPNAINGWDEEYEGWGLGEDSDVGSRLYHLGRPRKFVYGRAILYHLHHPILNRHHVPKSQARLDETIRTKKVRCQRGVDQYSK